MLTGYTLSAAVIPTEVHVNGPLQRVSALGRRDLQELARLLLWSQYRRRFVEANETDIFASSRQ